MDVLEFEGEYRWLSNFHSCKVVLDDVEYKSSEHAYQAAKFDDPVLKEKIRKGTAANAKKLGKSEGRRPDWNRVKIDVMRKCLISKFEDPELRAKLIAIDGEIVEGNAWHDVFWGVCEGKGENHLGKLLMSLRDELKALYDLGILP